MIWLSEECPPTKINQKVRIFLRTPWAEGIVHTQNKQSNASPLIRQYNLKENLSSSWKFFEVEEDEINSSSIRSSIRPSKNKLWRFQTSLIDSRKQIDTNSLLNRREKLVFKGLGTINPRQQPRMSMFPLNKIHVGRDLFQ